MERCLQPEFGRLYTSYRLLSAVTMQQPTHRVQLHHAPHEYLYIEQLLARALDACAWHGGLRSNFLCDILALPLLPTPVMCYVSAWWAAV